MPAGIYKHKNNQGFQQGHKIFLGRKHTEKTKEKMRIGSKNKGLGRKLPKWIREKMSDSQKKGKESRLWKGGVMSLHLAIRSCYKYRQWISDCFTRDDYTCQKCFKRGNGEIHVHHIKYFSEILKEYNISTIEDARKCEELWNINNGQT